MLFNKANVLFASDIIFISRNLDWRYFMLCLSENTCLWENTEKLWCSSFENKTSHSQKIFDL